MVDFAGFGLLAAGELTDAELAAAKRLATSTRINGNARQLHAYREYMELPNGGYAYSIKHGDIVRVRVVPGDRAAPREDEEPEYTDVDVPDFGSGFIVGGTILRRRTSRGLVEDAVMFDPEQETAKRFRIANEAQWYHRYVVEPHDDRADLRSQNPEIRFSQYVLLRASQFSGQMQKAVQLIMGFGKPDAPPTASTFSALSELLQKKQPPVVETAQQNEWRKQSYEHGVRVRYDSSYYRTHILTRSDDGKWYLAELGSRGVLVMPLPLWAGSDDPDFLQRAPEYGQDIAAALDEFKGLPSGDSFPGDSATFACMQRAGLIVTACPREDMAGYFELMPAASGFGWTCPTDGREAHNIGFGLDDNGYLYSEMWSAKINVGAWIPPTNATSRWLADATAKLKKAKAPAHLRGIVMSKLPYMNDSFLYDLLRGVVTPDEAYARVDAAQLSRFVATASAGPAGRNTAYNPNKRYPFKVPEPLLGGIVNFLLVREPGMGDPHAEPPMVMEAYLHVYYIGHRLKWLKYYWDRKTEEVDEVEDNYDDCMLSGNYYRNTRKGSTGVPPLMYTLDLDPRERRSPYEYRLTEFVRKRPEIVEWHSLDPAYLSRGEGYRNHYFEKFSDAEWEHDATDSSAAVIPLNVRNSLLYLHQHSNGGEGSSSSHTIFPRTDPWSYTGWVLWWHADKYPNPDGMQLPLPAIIYPDGPLADCPNRGSFKSTGVPIYAPTKCSHHYDYGPWANERCRLIPEGPQRNPPAAKPSRYEVDQDGKAKWVVIADFEGADGVVILQEDSDDAPHGAPNIWFAPSPDPQTGDVQFCNAILNCFGDPILVADTGPNGYGPGLRVGPTADENVRNKRANFIGVVYGT